MNKIWQNEDENKYYQIFNIENANYFIAELPENNNYVTLGIYDIFLNKEKNEYFDLNLIQKIKIKTEENYKGSKFININSSNKLFICLDNNYILFILIKMVLLV